MDCRLKARLSTGISPVLFGDTVIQGDGFDGVKAFDRKRGKRLWKYLVKSGISSPITLFNNHIYFGGADGFIHAVHAESGKPVWKFFTGSENLIEPLVRKDQVYVLTASQKIYLLSRKTGELTWIYAGPSLSRDFFVRGNYRPALDKLLYVGFHEGTLIALHPRTGKVKWKKKRFPEHAFSQPLSRDGVCLLTPVFNLGLFCINPRNGKLIWRTKGGASQVVFSGDSLYQADKQGSLYSMDRRQGSIKWKFKKSGLPLAPTVYKNLLLYGLKSDSKIYSINSKTGKQVSAYRFGRGLSARITVDSKKDEAYFYSVDSYLHKVRIEQ